MPIRISCDNCPFSTAVQDAFAGKRVKCPKCQSPIAVPAPSRAADEEDEEPVARPKPKVQVVDDEDDAPRPKPKKKPVVLDADDEDDAPRPKKKGKKASARRRDEEEAEGGKSKVWLFVGIGAAVLLLGGVGIFLATRGKTPEVAKPNDPQPGPVNPGPVTPGPVTPGPVTPGPGKEPPKPEPIPELKPRATLKVTFPEVFAVDLNADGTQAVIRSGGGGKSRFQVWNLAGEPKMEREVTKSLAGVMPGFKQYYRGQDDSFGFETVDLATDKLVKRWPSTLRLSHVAAQSGDVVSVAQMYKKAPDGKGDQFLATEWDLRSGEIRDRITIPQPSEFVFGGFADGGKMVAVGWRNSGKVQVWDVPNGKVAAEFTLPQIGKNFSFNGIQVSEDGKRLLLNGATFEPFKIVDATNGQVLNTLPAGSSNVAVFVPDSPLVLTRVSGIDWKKSQQFSGWLAHDTNANRSKCMLPTEGLGLAVSADGKTVATWNNFKKTDVQLWDLGQLAK